MGIQQFGNFYFDPKDIVAIDTSGEFDYLNESEDPDDHSDYYDVYLKNKPNLIHLEGRTARKALIAFLHENNKNA